MKPSEYLLKQNPKYNLFSYHNMYIFNQELEEWEDPTFTKEELDNACKYKDNLLDKLDKRFIDREKLKEKINKLFNPKISNGEHSIQITKKEILELLK